MKSGSLDVFATPALVALIEEAACNALNWVPVGSSSVGTAMTVEHLAATSLGRTVVAKATVAGIEEKSIQFDVEATDSTGSLIGRGTHSRAIVGVEKFMSRAGAKAEPAGTGAAPGAPPPRTGSQTVPRCQLSPSLSVSQIITGLWQVADLERDGGLGLEASTAAAALNQHADGGLTTFDMADHYGEGPSVATLAGLLVAFQRMGCRTLVA